MALNINLLRFLLLFSLFSLPSTVEGQTTSELDFTKVPGWNDYRGCVQDCFMAYCQIGMCTDQIGTQVTCSTNKCLCADKAVYELAIEKATFCVGISCKQNENDKAAATTIMTDYCALVGYDYDGSQDGTTSDPPSEDSPTSTSSSTPTTSLLTSPTTTPVDSPPTTNQDESKPTTTPSPSTTKDDPSETPDESSTKNQPTETPDSSSESKKGSDFGTPEIIGTVVGVASLIATALGVYLAWKKKHGNTQSQVAHVSPGVTPPPPPPMQYNYTNIVNAPTHNHHVAHNSHNNNRFW